MTSILFLNSHQLFYSLLKIHYESEGEKMLLSIALILIVSLTLAFLFEKVKLPGLIAMVLTGILLGPYVLDLIDEKILAVSSELREIALIVILLRAGLSLDFNKLKQVGRPAILLSFIPATIEIIAVMFLGVVLFEMPYLEAAVMGTVVAAVSPAIIVPRMIYLIDEGYGKEKGVPELVLAGASLDDIYVIVLFYAFVGLYQGGTISITTVLLVPVAIILGAILGIIVGLGLIWFFKKVHMRDTIKVLIIFSCAFLFLVMEKELLDTIYISGLIGVMALGVTLLKKYQILAERLTRKFEKIWVASEIALFVLVGSAVNILVIGSIGLFAVLLVVGALVFRVLAVFASLIKTNLNKKERLFVASSYLPKATVQAAIGAIPLSLGMPFGETILAIAVLSIIITAPLGAILIDRTYEKLLV